ncbi:hypothetical protein AB0C65_35895 [Nocardia sp. NPDC048505]|uniref:hypothetical protein n=1 Tax=Nocardia sp. NPDC048505 TaxID=3155756 RepID=UPI0033E129E3
MGSVRKWTKAEHDRHEADQHSTEWLEWVAPQRFTEQLNRFFAETVPDMPEDPYTVEGLDHAEAAWLELRPVGAPTPSELDVLDQFIRYIGETYRRTLGGEWVNLAQWSSPVERLRTLYPIIRAEYSELGVAPSQSIAIANRDQSGVVFRSFYERCADAANRLQG